ncbi:3-phosphoshikimate 1-carboxyvinyltransferase [Novosphingobium sp.]|uniref:3-phosphoshikimate 1-carboxyvinyltransferase n=1 Tax=Novosphingobium sp. TaxID=1874826 RepID=UPI003D10B9B2
MSQPISLAQPRRFVAKGPLTGAIRVPGDKSISHRSIMLGALAVGETRVTGLLEGEDVLATAAAMRAMGATIERQADGDWLVAGVGVGGLLQPAGALDMGNSGTSTRLLMGLVAGHAITACFIGDASLSKRPMGRVIAPLSDMGAKFTAYPGGRLPLIVTGAETPVPITYRLPVASAQVKSAVLLAGLNTPGVTTVIEPVPTRDHSERMLRGFGAELTVDIEDGARVIRLTGQPELRPQAIVVPGDPSSAAFFVVAALIVPGSDVLVENVGLNATRAALFDILRLMGGHIVAVNPREVGGEPVADLHVKASELTGITVDPAVVPAMVDEFPILFVAAALAHGRTITSGLEELRVKESDRIAAMCAALTLAGATLCETPDGMVIDGSGGKRLTGSGTTAIVTHLDHRIAMAMAVAGLASDNGVTVDDTRPIATSFPMFEQLLHQAGAA